MVKVQSSISDLQACEGGAFEDSRRATQWRGWDGPHKRTQVCMIRLITSLAGTQQRQLLHGLLLTLALLLAPCDATGEQNEGRESRETPVVLAYRRVAPSVVNIHGQKIVRGTAAAMSGDRGNSVRQVNGMGTGIIIDPRGYLLTNYHVVEEVSDIRVTLADKRTASGEVIASDPRYDLAVLKIELREPLQVVPMGTSCDLMVGERVIAIGNAFGYEDTVTEGIISALHRDVAVNETQEYRDLIQTSAGINPGNSGGPLVNILGEVIGINVAVRVGANSIAFAIPIDQAIDVARRIISTYNEERVWLGLAAATKTQANNVCLVVTKVDENSPALLSGMLPGDEITRVGNRRVSGPLDLELALLELQPGQRVGFDVKRGNMETKLDIEAVQPSFGASASPVQQRIWNGIGLQVEPLTSAAVKQLNAKLREVEKPYRGGLRVLNVRPGSPAERHLIRPGDVLLGLHKWQTTSLEDLDMILRNPEVRASAQASFYIVRRSQVHEGQMRLALLPD